ncbi:MAG: 2-oxoacid:acceptor oxidoreductase family protein [Erysipelotrichaceae bacterium]|nr:2-oxoacid:acceptor oxidoreductase family protein [Erysipelotrichaceae bacterium]
MERDLIVGGFGGQGVMRLAQLMCYTATETTDKYVSYFPTYGGEQRGGTANCFVIISDEKIGAMTAPKCDDLIVFNNPSLAKFEARLKPNGTMFVNTTVATDAPKRTDIKIVNVPATEIANEVGDIRCANLAMLGAYIGYTGLLPAENIKKTAEKKLGAKRPELIPLNNAAFDRGFEIGKAAREAEKEA